MVPRRTAYRLLLMMTIVMVMMVVMVMAMVMMLVMTMVMTMMMVATESGQGEINTGEAGDEINANDGRQTSFSACHTTDTKSYIFKGVWQNSTPPPKITDREK